MDFQRIDKNTVQCRMTEEEMNEFGFQIEDFFNDQEKSREFLEQIVERAEEEIGYEVESGMVSMQLMRMPDNSLTITFSEQGEDGLQSMLQHIQHLAGMIDENMAEEIMDGLQKEIEKERKKKIHNSENEEETQKNHSLTDKEQQRAYQKHMREIARIQREKEKKKIAAAKVFSFDTLQNLEQFATDFVFEKNISSKVYRDQKEGTYYLLIKKGKLKLEEYQHLCRRLLDYGTLCSEQPFVEQYCKEHLDCLISKHALQVLREYC